MPSRTLDDPRRLLLPKLTLAPVAALPGGSLPAAAIDITDDPANASASRVHWASEAAMSFDVAPADLLPASVFDVTVTNPDGVHASTLDQVLAILPPPIVSKVTPPAVCDDQSDQTVVVTGASFLAFKGATPAITIKTSSGDKTYASRFAAADCAAIPGNFAERAAQLCTVAPATVCAGGAQLTINGSSFLPSASVAMRCPSVDVTASQEPFARMACRSPRRSAAALRPTRRAMSS